VRTDDPADGGPASANPRAAPPDTVVWALGPVILRADVPALCAHLAGLLDEGVSVVVCDVSTVAGADAAAVDALARLHLAARRRGRRILIRGGDPHLVGLLRLVGLRDALPLA
jgi:ABC-type transporter Mla MlaB component